MIPEITSWLTRGSITALFAPKNPPELNGYRPDIDGLRALAVISVVLFHAKLPGIDGGFVGVDIFFVISGFLITRIISQELQNGKFSIFAFYERRARRILPALTVMISSVLLASYFVFIWPEDFISLGEQAFAQSLFLSNVHFMRSDAYFAAPSETKALLHTWSLSVEEQFYILFPAIMIIASRVSRGFVVFLLVGIALSSFTLNWWLVEVTPSNNFAPSLFFDIWGSAKHGAAGFYMLPSRAWELAIGAAVAVKGDGVQSRTGAECLSLMGLMAILWSVFFIDDTYAFPGAIALVPTLGATFVIISNTHHQTFTRRILSMKGMVWVGLISYSLYLWHWPIFVAAKSVFAQDLSTMQMLALSVLSVCAAWLSYRYVESPFRRRQFLSKRQVFSYSLVSLAIPASLGLAMHFSDGFPGRLPTEARALANVNASMNPRHDECFTLRLDQLVQNGPCTIGDLTSEFAPDFVLWGDSHSDAIFPALDVVARKTGAKGVYFGTGGCPGVANVYTKNSKYLCQKVNAIADEYIKTNNITDVFLVSRWWHYMTKYPDNLGGALASDQGLESETTGDAEIVIKVNLLRMLNEYKIRGIRTWIVKSVPEHSGFDPRELAYQYTFGIKPSLGMDRSETDLVRRRKTVNSWLDDLVKNGVAEVLDPGSLICTSVGGCVIGDKGGIFYRDGNHLSQYGASVVKGVFYLPLGLRSR